MPKDWVLAASRAEAGPAAGHATGETLAVPWDRGLGTGVCCVRSFLLALSAAKDGAGQGPGMAPLSGRELGDGSRRCVCRTAVG